MDAGYILRFIPMCMGNASVNNRWVCQPPVHPHVHGERLPGLQLYNLAIGSSPCAWGTRTGTGKRAADYRFIPMCMGNARFVSGIYELPAVHPHVHGERSPIWIHRQLVIGSSPCAWGTQAIEDKAGFLHRFIPMCMGNAQTGLTPLRR